MPLERTAQVLFHRDVASLLGEAEAMLLAEEPLSTMLLGVCGELQRQVVPGRPLWNPTERFGTTAALGDEAVLAAVQTPPYGLLVHVRQDVRGPTYDALLRRVLDHWQDEGLRPNNVLGPKRIAEDIARRWSRRLGLTVRPRLRMRLFDLEEVTPAAPREGRLRRATAADEALVGQWFDAFNREALGMDDPAAASVMARQRIAMGEIYLWQEDEVLAMAGRSRATASSVSVGHVYTPPAGRGRGVAACCVAALSQALLDEGFQRCTLYTDLTNPVSNRLYARLGYRPLDDFTEMVFSPGA